jgi:hypothetical protein
VNALVAARLEHLAETARAFATPPQLAKVQP